jgi:GT2 family glycosyltransferase
VSGPSEPAEIVKTHSGIKYLYLPQGKNKMTQARNLGVMTAQGEVVVFIDDDSMVTDNWLAELISGYRDKTVGGVGGRVLDEIELKYLDPIPVVGKVLPGGQLINNFAVELDEMIEVDRFKGCNMSFRKDVLQQVGLFDNFYRTNWDDVDICIRVKKAGYKLLFNPGALVNHLTAPQEDGLPRSTTNPRVMFMYSRNRSYFAVSHLGCHRQNLVPLLVHDTRYHLSLFLKTPSISTMQELTANVQGKIVGTVAALQKQLFRRFK